jgi:hypothetical protein
MADQQKELWKTHNAIPEQQKARDQTNERLDRLIGLMKGGYQPGAFAEEKANIVADLKAFGINVPPTATANPAAFQIFMKEHNQLLANQVKAMGNRPLVMEFKTFGMGNPNPEMQPQANAAILSEMKGVINWESQYAKDFAAWHNKNPGAYDETQFSTPWLAKNKLEKFIDPEALKFAYPGQDIPAASQRLNGQHYMTGKGERIWDEEKWKKAGSPSNGAGGWIVPAGQ